MRSAGIRWLGSAGAQVARRISRRSVAFEDATGCEYFCGIFGDSPGVDTLAASLELFGQRGHPPIRLSRCYLGCTPIWRFAIMAVKPPSREDQ